MSSTSFHLFDWKRLLLGNVPETFLIEVCFRSILMYAALIITLRLLGKRMNGQLSITELAVMISLGAIVSLPMESPDQGLLPGLILLFLILVFQRGLGYLSVKSRKIERLFYGGMCILVKDGVLQVETMKREGITKDQLFAQLRHKGIDQLGELDRVYLEAHGVFSPFKARTPKPGLSTLPEKDDAFLAAQHGERGVRVCSCCGSAFADHEMEADECPRCHNRQWTQAVI